MEQEQRLVCLMGFRYSIVKNSYSPYRGLTPVIHLELGSGIAAKYMSLSFFLSSYSLIFPEPFADQQY